MPSNIFEEIDTLEKLNCLDHDAIVRGYRDALDGFADHTRTDQAYWHGHGNAHSDRNNFSTPAQQRLAREIVEDMRKRKADSGNSPSVKNVAHCEVVEACDPHTYLYKTRRNQ